MSEEKEAYKQIFKATSVFGGLQVFNILISIIKSKFIAILLGPAGLGVISIFNSTSSLIASCTNLGVNISAVKSIASANQSSNKNEQPVIIAVVKKLIWFTGLLGLAITVICSPWLSQVSFGNKSYTFSFMLLGLSLLALQISSGQLAILQGLRQIKLIALSSLSGALLGLFISVPLYYYFGAEGIVPAIVASTIVAAIASWYFLRKMQVDNVHVDLSTIKAEGKQIIKLGILISLTSIFPAIVAYGVRLFIANIGSIEDVGLYTAGFAIVGTYVGMIFTAMSTDYYPSLAQVSNDNVKCSQKVNQQLLVSILILAPIVAVLLVFIKIGILILYSAKFLGTVKMIQWSALGVFFQVFSFCIAYLFLAKGDSKVYFWNELIPNIYTLLINCVAYYIWGLEGMGISFLIAYFLYFIQVYLVAKKRYNFEFDTEIAKICFLQFLILAGVFACVYFLPPLYAYITGSALIVVSVVVSVKSFSSRVGLNGALSKITNRFYKKNNIS